MKLTSSTIYQVLEENALAYLTDKIITKFAYPVKRLYKRHFRSTYRYFGEFGFECLNSIPYAYYLHQKGVLKKTVAVAGTRPLYYFSPRHEERAIPRNCLKSYPALPVNRCYADPWDTSEWVPPPYKKQYANRDHVYDKPLLVVANKYNSEWNQAPVNYLSLSLLEFIFQRFSGKYRIVYSRYTIEDDNSSVYDLGDFNFIRKNYPGVILMQDLAEKNRMSWNEQQLRVYANCDKFISVQGGPAVICSYFGGDNCIFARKGFELLSGELERVYPLLSGCRIHVAPYCKEDMEWDVTRFIRALKVPVVRNLQEGLFKDLLTTVL